VEGVLGSLDAVERVCICALAECVSECYICERINADADMRDQSRPGSRFGRSLPMAYCLLTGTLIVVGLIVFFALSVGSKAIDSGLSAVISILVIIFIAGLVAGLGYFSGILLFRYFRRKKKSMADESVESFNVFRVYARKCGIFLGLPRVISRFKEPGNAPYLFSSDVDGSIDSQISNSLDSANDSTVLGRQFAPVGRWLPPVLGVLAFLLACLMPLIVTHVESGVAEQARLGRLDSQRYEYYPLKGAMRGLEKRIATENGIKNFESPRRPMYLKWEVLKVDNLDLDRNTIHVEGKISGVWGEESIGRDLISTDKYLEMSLKGYEASRAMDDLRFPDINNDGDYYYRKVSQKKATGKRGEYFAAEYEFGGNIRFNPDLSHYPADNQKVYLRVQHKLLPSYMLNLRVAGEKNSPSIRARSSDLVIDEYIITADKALPESIEAGYSPALVSCLEFGKKCESGLSDIQSALFAFSPSPSSVAGIEFDLRRRLAATWFRAIFPVSIALLAMLVTSYIPRSDIGILAFAYAIPPTILLALMFMQQSVYSGLPATGKPMALDYFYIVGYVSIFSGYAELIVSSKLGQDSSVSRVLKLGCRFLYVSSSVFGPLMIWVTGVMSA